MTQSDAATVARNHSEEPFVTQPSPEQAADAAAVDPEVDAEVDAEADAELDAELDAAEQPERTDAVDAEAAGADADGANADAGADTSGTDDDPLADFRAALRAKEGDWYVVHTYSGMENRVKANLQNRIQSLHMEDRIHEVVVPTEEVAEIKSGQRKLVKRTRFPGYVLVRMDMSDESWSAVRNTPAVTGFVGREHQPIPLSIDEVVGWLAPAVAAQTAEKPSARPTIEVADFAVGDSVMVIDGPFQNMHATISEINADSQKIRGLVELFGRETPVELSLSQIQKL